MAVILKETKSTGSSPYAYYTVNASASDRTVNTVKVSGTIDSRLSSSSASLGAGGTMGLIAYLKFNDKEYSVELKKTTEKWSGTTTHTKSFSFTIEDLESSQSQLSDIKFRVSRTGSAANNYTKGAAMSSKNCSNLQIGIGHTNPSDVSLTITEKNQKLIDAGITNNTYVNNLSIKEYNIAATLHDGATATDYNLYNGIVPSFNKSTPFTIDYSIKELITWQETGKVPMRAQVLDNLGGNGYSSSASEPTLYDYIPYMKVNFNESQTVVKRNGQMSGKVKLNVNGTFYNGNIGNVTQGKPIIKYKYWKLGETEPLTFDNTIPSDNITVSENNFSVSGFEIGSIDETASNYFNPENVYRVKVYVEDNFTNYSSTEKPIPVGEYTWAEYKDRVDFKKATIKGKDIISDIVYSDNQVLWDPGEGKGYYMVASHTINLSQKVSEQKSGIVLVWQAYSNSTVQAYDFNFTFIPKWQVSVNSSRGVSCFLTDSTAGVIGTKYVYVYDDKIVGNNANSNGATKRNSGITTTNNRWVLTHVLGV
ncbi:MAG: hypothetical protein SPI44_05665 [Bacilli bacterium]|nr:hypothetical protein [Bacilli bacterium]